MINPKTTATPAGERELLIEREFAAPRELVFKAWTERDRLMQWWGPPTWPIDYCTVDLGVGGAWHYRMRGPAGEEGWGKGVYREIMPSSRLVYSDYFSDEDGTEIPPEAIAEIDFVDRGGTTLVRNKTIFASGEHREQVLGMGVVEGMSETMDRLDEHLAAVAAG